MGDALTGTMTDITHDGQMDRTDDAQMDATIDITRCTHGFNG